MKIMEKPILFFTYTLFLVNSWIMWSISNLVARKVICEDQIQKQQYQYKATENSSKLNKREEGAGGVGIKGERGGSGGRKLLKM